MAILINDTTPRVQYTATSGQTVFTVSFEFFENADLKVYKNSTLLTLTTHYTVTGAGVTGGGSITLVTGATAGDVLTITRDIAVKRVTDFPTSGPFNVDALNTDLDRLTAMMQERENGLTRVIQLSETDAAVNLQLPIAASRASKVLGFDTTGNAIAMQELGNYRGNWAATTAYVLRDIVKDTSNSNIYICITAHTSAGSQPISSNADSAKWALIVDAAAAATSASNAATSETNAAASASVANEWATKTAGPVAGGEYSAKYHAQAASTSASNASTSASNAATSESNATTSASNAATSASNAASSASSASSSASAASASAAAAAAAAASGLYRQVLDKNANYTIVAADQGSLFRGDTSSGAITFTLPQISSVSDGFKVSIVKWTSDANPVNITRSGSDTINGATSTQIGSQYSQIIFVADFETNTWFASQSGLGATNMNIDVFSGNGSTTAFTLSSDPGSENNTDVFIGGVHQDHSTYSTSGTTLTFSTAPPSGTGNIEVCYGTPLPIGTPSDGTVSASKIAANAVDLTTKVTGTLPVANGGTGASTLAANSVLLGNGTSALQVVSPGTSGNVLTSNGTTWQSSAPTSTGVNVQTFTSSGTWTKPSLAAGSRVLIQAWGGGGSGGRANANMGGGGGGGYNERWLTLSQMGATETVTIGAGGAAKTTNGAGNDGGNTSVGSLITAYGGGGSIAATNQGGGGGGQLSAASSSGGTNPGKPWYLFNTDGGGGNAYLGTGGAGSSAGNAGVEAFNHGGGGGAGGGINAGGASVWGGGGGGGGNTTTNVGSGGVSSFGGNGSAGTQSTAASAGSQPGGGGGGTGSGTSGAGGAGQVIITVFPA